MRKLNRETLELLFLSILCLAATVYAAVTGHERTSLLTILTLLMILLLLISRVRYKNKTVMTLQARGRRKRHQST